MSEIKIEKLIETTNGFMPECDLEKKEGPGWVEYYCDGELVHRSAEVGIKGVQADAVAAKIGPQPS